MSFKQSALMLGATVGTLAAATVYTRAVRPWMLRWGARHSEVAQGLPGDELLSCPKLDSTHAITIHAPASEVWAWLVQIGQGRGGFYSYDWIENMMGLEIENADRIRPEWQELKVGDKVMLAPDFGIPVAIAQTHRALVLFGDTRLDPSAIPTIRPGDYFAATWGWYLQELDAGTTRLVERWRADWNPSVSNAVFMRLFLEPGAFVMQRKMLLTIRELAEHASAQKEILAWTNS